MPLVEAKCTNCGAVLKIDNEKDAAICQYCGAAFIVEKAISNYNITNNNVIHAQVVNVYGGGRQTVFAPVLTKVGPEKIKVIKLIREQTGFGLADARAFVESLPKAIKENVSETEAYAIKSKLEAVGATVEVR